MNERRKHIILICFIADPFDPIGTERIGGGHQYILDLGRYLIQNKFSVTFVTRKNHPDKLIMEELGPFSTIYRIECGQQSELQPDAVGKMMEKLKYKTRQLLDKISPIDVIHSHYWISGFAVMDYCKEKTIRHVHTVLSIGKIKFHLGEPISDIDDFRYSCEEQIYKEAKAIIVICPNERKAFQHYFPNIDQNKVYIIPNGIDTKIFYPRDSTSGNYFLRSTNRFKKGISSFH